MHQVCKFLKQTSHLPRAGNSKGGLLYILQILSIFLANGLAILAYISLVVGDVLRFDDATSTLCFEEDGLTFPFNSKDTIISLFCFEDSMTLTLDL